MTAVFTPRTIKMSIADLIQAAEFIERRDRVLFIADAEHGYASALPIYEDPKPGGRRPKTKKSQGSRTTHNELEKNRYILDNQDLLRSIIEDLVKDRNVLDIGCGCGAGSIAAAKMKAKYVLANDIDHYALAATHLNANLNGVLIDTSSKNLIGTKCEEFNVILIGDMFYDEDFSQTLFKWLIKLHEAGKTILIGDPGRHGLTEKRRRHVQMLAEYKMPRESQEENNGFTKTKIWKLNKLI